MEGAVRFSRMTPALAGALGLAAAVACGGVGAPQVPIPVEAYNGSWRLDQSATETMQREDDARRRVGGGDRRVRMAAPDRSPTAAERDAMRVAVPRAGSLTLEVTDSLVTVEEGRRTLLVSVDDGYQDVWQGVDVEINASWEHGALHFERNFPGGVRVREEFTIDEDGRLIVEMIVSAPSFPQNRRVRRVYNPVSGG